MSLIDTERLIFYENPPSLKNMAAIAVTAVVWRHKINQHSNFRALEAAHPKVESLLEVPSDISKLINKWIEPMKTSLGLWLEVHHLRIFFPHRKKYKILKKYFDFISWDSNCIINDVRTAKNMMACPELNSTFKFKIACSYCFENDLRRLWSESHVIIDFLNLAFESNPLLDYWCTRLADEADKEPIVMDGSTEAAIILKQEHDNISALMYLWSRLRSNDQINKAVFIAENCLRHEVEALLRSLTKPQFELVIELCYKDILLTLVRTPKNVEFGLQIWHYMRELVTPEGFYETFKTILHSELDINHQHLNSLVETINRDVPNSEIFDEDAIVNVNVASFLYDIFLDTSDDLKNYVISNHVDEVLNKLCEKDVNFVTNLCRDVRLIIFLLSQRGRHQNNSFWRKRWLDLIKGVRPETINLLMKLCFRNDREIANFKKNNFTIFLKINKYCDKLIEGGNFNELNEFLTFCSSDRNVRVGLKRKIISNPMGTIRYCCHYIENEDKMRAFDNFISDISPDIEKRKNLKCQIITSAGNFKLLEMFVAGGFIRQVKQLVCSFVTRPADLKAVKRNFKQHCQRFLKQCEFQTFDVNELNDFIIWCVNDDQKQLDKIKQSIPIDFVFNVLFEKCVGKIENYLYVASDLYSDDDLDEDTFNDDIESIEDDDNNGQREDASDEKSSGSELAANCTSNYGCTHSCDHTEFEKIVNDNEEDDDPLDHFNRLNNFLSWYFAGQEKVERFKLDKLKAEDASALYKVLASGNRRLTDIVLRWIFDRDTEKIKSYKASGTV